MPAKYHNLRIVQREDSRFDLLYDDDEEDGAVAGTFPDVDGAELHLAELQRTNEEDEADDG